MVPSICAGCQSAILDKFLLKVLDKVWHVECVRCVVCHVAMETKCFARDGQLYCREDFFRHYGVKCNGCSRGISPEDLVRRTRNAVYHVKCFICASCKKEPATGDELFLLDDNSFICKDDYFAGKHHVALLSSADVFTNNIGINNNNNNTSDNGSLMMMVSPIEMTDETASACSPISSSYPSNDSLQLTCLSPAEAFRPQGSSIRQMAFPGNSMARSFDLIHARPLLPEAEFPPEVTSGVAKNLRRPENPTKTKDGRPAVTVPDQGLVKKRGPRTTIKAKQLETLKAAFLHSPKPTRHLREKLAAETSLSMRVIQVWFQNRRSKERRMRQLNVTSAVSHQGNLRRPPFYRTHRRLAGVSDAFRLASSSVWATDSVGGGGGGRLMEARRDSQSRQPRPLISYFEGGSGFLLSSGGGQHHHPTEDCIRILDNSCGSCDSSPVKSSPTTTGDDLKSFGLAGNRSQSAVDSSSSPPSDNLPSSLIRRSLSLLPSPAAAAAGPSRSTRRSNGVMNTTTPADSSIGHRSNPRTSFAQQGQTVEWSDE